MGLALALPLALELLVRNVRGATGDFSDAVGMRCTSRRKSAKRPRGSWLRTLRERTQALPNVTLITAAQALAEFRAQSGFGAALDALTGQSAAARADRCVPPPMRPRPARLEALRQAVMAWPEVESVQLDRDWVQRFGAMLELLRR